MRRISYQKWGMILVIGFLIFFLLPYQVGATTWEYYTYGGYNAVVDAWRRVGLIFSDSRFVGLYFSVIALGMIILYFVVMIRATLSGSARFNLAAWAVPVLIGMAIYIALIVPKDRIVVYDPVLNRGPETIGNIPRVMATTAGLLNKIEKGMIDIVSTTTTPVEDYTRNAGGAGFIILSQFGDQVAVLAGVPTYVWLTAYKFIEDCVFFELRRPGTQLTTKQIEKGEKSFAQIIQESKNPGVPTVYYDENGNEVDTMGGMSVTCQEAGDKLLTYLRDVNLEAVIKKSCILSGFNIDNPVEWNQCRTLVESTYKDGLREATGGEGNLNLLVAQKLLAEVLINVLNTINPEGGIKVMATKEASGQYLGLVIHANTWLPIIKETLRAVSIAISPFVLLFAATPLVGRALGFMLGMMVWLVTWTVIDAILHYAAVSQAVAASKEFSDVITNGTPGTMLFALLPSYSAKVAATFGAIRWAGLGLATVLTGMLIRFGGAALAMVAGSITGAAQSAGAAMGRMVTDVTSPIRADLVPTASWTNAAVAAGGVSALAGGLIEQQAGSMLGQSRVGNALGMRTIAESTYGAGMWSAASGLAQANVMKRYGFKRITDAFTGSTTWGVLNAMAQGQALTELGENEVQKALTNFTFKHIGSGSAYKDPKEAYWIGKVGEEKTIGELEAFDKVSRKYGGPRAFAEMIATKNYTALGQALEEYAMLRGISLEQAAYEMGKILGTQEAIKTSATGHAIDTVGDKQLEEAEVYNALRNAAEASMLYNFAKTLGYAGSPDDFQGIYKALKSRQSEMSFTLNEAGAKRLNAMLKQLGYKNVNFQAGDRVTMAMDEKGNITVAKGERGASQNIFDKRHEEQGTLKHQYRINKEEFYRLVDRLNRFFYGSESIFKKNTIKEERSEEYDTQFKLVKRIPLIVERVEPDPNKIEVFPGMDTPWMFVQNIYARDPETGGLIPVLTKRETGERSIYNKDRIELRTGAEVTGLGSELFGQIAGSPQAKLEAAKVGYLFSSMSKIAVGVRRIRPPVAPKK